MLTRKHTRKELTLLLLGALPQQRTTKHLDPERVVVAHGRHPNASQFLDQNDLLEFREAGAAVLLRPRDAQQSGPGQRGSPRLDKAISLLSVGNRANALPVRWEVVLEQPTDA
jgi:hypothetical protein